MKAYNSRGSLVYLFEVSTHDIKGVTFSFNFISNLALGRLCRLPVGV